MMALTPASRLIVVFFTQRKFLHKQGRARRTETLKYAYLLFSPADELPLDLFVLNTEAHPLRIAGRPDGRASGAVAASAYNARRSLARARPPAPNPTLYPVAASAYNARRSLAGGLPPTPRAPAQPAPCPWGPLRRTGMR